MIPILKKDLKHFLNSLTGIVSVAVFLTMNGVFLFLFKDTNLLEYGYASMNYFFDITPYTLIFLVAAITMKSFSDEFKIGTYEILVSRPLTTNAIIIGKILASFIIIIFALLPTLVYVYSLSTLSATPNGLDLGATLAAYCGLLLLSLVYITISVYCSSSTKNNITAFLFSLLINYFIYDGIQQISQLQWFNNDTNFLLETLSLQFHFNSIAKGVINLPNIVYCLSLITLFIFLTKKKLHLNK